MNSLPLLCIVHIGLHLAPLALSGGFRAARLPGHATHAARAVSSWVEKNLVPPLNRQALDWSVVLTIGRLCPIVPRDNIVVSNKYN